MHIASKIYYNDTSSSVIWETINPFLSLFLKLSGVMWMTITLKTYSGYFEEEKFGNYCPLLLRQR